MDIPQGSCPRLTRFSYLLLVMLALLSFAAPVLFSQSITSGDVTGVVTDPSGAVVPNVPVTVKSNSNGATITRNTNSDGVYRFPLLSPGSYTVSSAATGFQSTTRTVTVALGQTTVADIKLSVGTTNTTVEVTGEAPILQTENADGNTTFNAAQISEVPNPGNDLSYVAQTAPGATMNTQGGFGNFSTFGLPGTSNLFTYNGMNENDPFLNLNNSGATNLLLGNNDVQEATVVNNGYSGQYGGLAGANVNYVSKSGSNAWHGNALYWWDGRVMNANNWFNKAVVPGQGTVTPRPFVNANQYAASFGGPIRKDKTFFFVDYEGLRVVLPTNQKANIPSPQYQAATLANLATMSPGSIPFYQKMFALWNGAAGATNAGNVLQQGTDSTGAATGPGCGSFNGLGSAAIPCALQFQSVAGNFTHEYLLTARVDQNFGSNDRVFVRFRDDHGTQATFTDAINPVFNAVSIQPQYEGQASWSHAFNSGAVNQFIVAGSWYSAIFKPLDLAASLNAFPTTLSFSGGLFSTLGRDLFIWPQGRNVTQYQFIDDYSKTLGNHTLKFGANFHRDDISDHDFGFFQSGLSTAESLTDFFNGSGDVFIQNFPTSLNQPIATYGLGLYAQDEWSARPSLKLTLALRAEHVANPVCQTNCFARFNAPFAQINHDPSIPYNQVIKTGLHQLVPDLTNIGWQPRFGFAWTPFGLHNTVVRGGIGIFIDSAPAFVADSISQNPPLDPEFLVVGSPLSPNVPSNEFQVAAQSNTGFQTGFKQGQNFAQISSSVPGLFFPPSFFNTAAKIKLPQYQEWNLQVQQGFGSKTVLTLNYVGNHGIHEAVTNPNLNAFCPSDGTCAPAGVPFPGLPAAAPAGAFGTVTEVSSTAVSNYNGLTVSFQRKFTAGLMVQANYTWSHAMDEVSNGGFLQYNFSSNTSLLNPQDAVDLRKYNYGNADYDNRHYFSTNFLYELPYKFGPKVLLRGWQISGTVFTRTGLPFTVVDSNAGGLLSGFNYGANAAVTFATAVTHGTTGCSASAANPDPKAPGCLLASQFGPASDGTVVTGFGAQRRNQYYGPKFFNTNLTLMKNTKIPGWEKGQLGLGAQFFNVFNHANFDQPIGDIANSQFGKIVSTVNTPTSILGSFLGGDASPRLIQLTAKFTF